MTGAYDDVTSADAMTVSHLEDDVIGARLDAFYQRLREGACSALLSGIVEEPARQPDGIHRRGVRGVQRAPPARAVAQHQVVASQEIDVDARFLAQAQLVEQTGPVAAPRREVHALASAEVGTAPETFVERIQQAYRVD